MNQTPIYFIDNNGNRYINTIGDYYIAGYTEQLVPLYCIPCIYKDSIKQYAPYIFVNGKFVKFNSHINYIGVYPPVGDAIVGIVRAW